jgi:hypothetical protein
MFMNQIETKSFDISKSDNKDVVIDCALLYMIKTKGASSSIGDVRDHHL